MESNQFELSSSDLKFYPRSLVSLNGIEFGLAQEDGKRLFAVLAPLLSSSLSSFEGQPSEFYGKTLLVGPPSPKNAAALRDRLDWLNPTLIGLETSFGFGDRMGLATPGHVRAARSTNGKIAPIFAQQSMREMERTNRTPQKVMDDATWGIFEEGWHEGVGADADHLKTPKDIDDCLATGYTFFTIDPGDHVENKAETANLSELQEMAGQLPADFQPPATGLLGKAFDLDGLIIQIDKATLYKAVVKYGWAIVHVVSMYEHLKNSAGNKQFELEVSVDETELPTSHAEHIYIASELKRMGVSWVSLAPRFVGRFEKGVDYIGDTMDFEEDVAGHAIIAHHFGPYKLSLHSGSDKFSIYSILNQHTGGLLHIKTAGTSYLEVLRTIAAQDVDLISEIYTFSRQHFTEDKATYHISAQLSRAPLPEDVTDWSSLFDLFDPREIFHVTFGSVLTHKPPPGGRSFYERIVEFLAHNQETYAVNLEKHFKKHLQPLIPQD